MQPNVPLAEEIACSEAIALLAGVAGKPWTLLFDSAAPGDPRGRYSYLCLDPADRLAVPRDAAHSQVDGMAAPLAWLARRLRGWPQLRRPDLPPFQGGAAGLLSYEFGGWLERLPAPAEDGPPHPVAALAIYDVVVAIDHVARRAWIISTGYPETAPDRRDRRARERLAAVRAGLERCAASMAPADATPLPPLDWASDTRRGAYLSKVRRAIDYIRAGDVFQVNLSRELVAARPDDLSAFALYSDMRRRTQAPFSAYLALDDGMAVCSFSPERFVQVGADGAVETRPIKGTRPRGRDAVSDAALAAELTQSRKDRAENLMIVDLLRNDIGRVCRTGSIAVPQLCGLESFAAVHHLVSVVTGRLAGARDSVDLLAAVFPGGSITGAPKIRAMEIIHELEGRRRGPYCGTLCWLGFDGSMDSSILIRTMAVDRAHIRYGVGGGIVADSESEAEWHETEVKAAAFTGVGHGKKSDAILS